MNVNDRRSKVGPPEYKLGSGVLGPPMVCVPESLLQSHNKLLHDAHAECERLTESNDSLSTWNDRLRQENERLKQEIKDLSTWNDRLRQLNVGL